MYKILNPQIFVLHKFELQRVYHFLLQLQLLAFLAHHLDVVLWDFISTYQVLQKLDVLFHVRVKLALFAMEVEKFVRDLDFFYGLLYH